MRGLLVTVLAVSAVGLGGCSSLSFHQHSVVTQADPTGGRILPSHDVNRDRHGPADVDAYIESLEAGTRDAWQKPDEVIAALRLHPDATVADIGCGPGYFTRRLARAVPAGVVYAVDVEPRQLDRLNQRLSEDGLKNVVPILAPPDDARIPSNRVDLILIVDTYHPFPDRIRYLERLGQSLAAGGRVAIVDYHKKELPVGPPVDHKLAREVVIQEAAAAGLRLIAEPTFLEYQYFLIFER